MSIMSKMSKLMYKYFTVTVSSVRIRIVGQLDKAIRHIKRKKDGHTKIL